jgi:hypothetical protein
MFYTLTTGTILVVLIYSEQNWYNAFAHYMTSFLIKYSVSDTGGKYSMCRWYRYISN